MVPIRRLTVALGASFIAFALWQTPVAAAHKVPRASPVAALYNAAQHEFAGGNVRAGLDDLNRAVAIAPDNASVLALRALWAAQVNDLLARNDSLAWLSVIDPALQSRVLDAYKAIYAAAPLPPDPFPSIQGSSTAIVVLGYGLTPDGQMRPELIDRLHAAWVQAIAAPLSPIITTGGNPHNGVTEGQAMAGWLIAHGIPAGRIHPETFADSTVQNAEFSAGIIRAIGANDAVLVTSPNHIRRSTADFLLAGVPIVGAMTSQNNWITQLPPPSPADLRGMFLDASKLLGLPASL